MAWNPQKRQIDTRVLVENLLTFVEAQQVEALAWAANNAAPALAPFARIFPSAAGRVREIYPNLMVIRRERANAYGAGDLLECVVRVTLEGQITGSDPDDLVEKAEIYSSAVESLVTNIPKNELLLNLRYFQTAQIDSIESDLDVTRGNGTGAFMQVFQTQFTILLRGGING